MKPDKGAGNAFSYGIFEWWRNRLSSYPMSKSAPSIITWFERLFRIKRYYII